MNKSPYTLKVKSLILIVFLLFLSLSSVSIFSQDKIEIKIENKKANNHFGINQFYFIHQTFADAFFMTDLYKQLNYDEMTSILQAIFRGITDKDKVNIVIKQKDSPNAKLIFYTMKHEVKGHTLIMSTNFNSKKRKFEKKMNKNQSVVRWYFIRGEKLVYRKDEYSKPEEEKRKEEGSSKLLDYYFFDDNIENDSKVKSLIDSILVTSKDKIEVLYAKLYLGEYWLREGEIEKAEVEVSKLKEYFESESEISRAYSLIINMATTELEITKRFKI